MIIAYRGTPTSSPYISNWSWQWYHSPPVITGNISRTWDVWQCSFYSLLISNEIWHWYQLLWVNAGSSTLSYQMGTFRGKPDNRLIPGDADGQIFHNDKQSPSKYPYLDSLDDMWPQLYSHLWPASKTISYYLYLHQGTIILQFLSPIRYTGRQGTIILQFLSPIRYTGRQGTIILQFISPIRYTGRQGTIILQFLSPIRYTGRQASHRDIWNHTAIKSIPTSFRSIVTHCFLYKYIV